MKEIRIPDRPVKGKLKDIQSDDDSGFEVHSIEEVATPADDLTDNDRPVGEKVKVRFDKFVQLVATHNFDEILQQNKDEELVMSSNLLMDLANAHEDNDTDKKTPTIFVIGLALGVVFTYILFKFF